MQREGARVLALVIGAVLCGLAATEGALRVALRPCDRAWGTVLGVALPPFAIFPALPPPAGAPPVEERAPRPHRDAGAAAPATTAPGGRGAPDDLRGVLRADPLLGYAPKEGAVSTSGWWSFNRLGARARHETSDTVAAGARRLLVFGESFAAGSRIPFEASWPAQLEAAVDGLEVVNLAVDGYGMGQSFLRYQTLEQRVQYDGVLMAFVPSADLWRDVNTVRYLGERWNLHTVMPRFVLEHDELELVRPPAAPGALDRWDPGPALRAHLRRYEAFYWARVHEEPRGLGRLVISRLVASSLYRRRMRRLREDMLAVDSEAMRIERAIFSVMHAQLRARGRWFAVAVTPTAHDVHRARTDPAFAARWRAMIAALEGMGVRCIDLMEDLSRHPAGALDTGVDGSHYGPRANALIAARLAREVRGLAPHRREGSTRDDASRNGESFPRLGRRRGDATDGRLVRRPDT